MDLSIYGLIISSSENGMDRRLGSRLLTLRTGKYMLGLYLAVVEDYDYYFILTTMERIVLTLMSSIVIFDFSYSLIFYDDTS